MSKAWGLFVVVCAGLVGGGFVARAQATGAAAVPAGAAAKKTCTVSTAAPNAVPKLDTRPSCESPGRKAIAHTGSIQACMRSENEAHEELIKQWSQYAKTDRANCIGKVTKGGPPSYIELHSCLVTMKHVREIRKAHPHPSG